MSFEKREKIRTCCAEDCQLEAEFPAPKKRVLPRSFAEKLSSSANNYIVQEDDIPVEKDWFCQEHIREYNKNWDFFSGMSVEEIEKFREDSVTGHRKTKKVSARGYASAAEMAYEKAWRVRDGNETNQNNFEFPKELSPDNERDAMRILGVSHPLTKEKIKKAYRELVKKFHPDRNREIGEDRIKIINSAYGFLKSYCIN